MDCPSVAVIIPTLNEQKALPATLDSLLMQDGWSEAWVVDGGSCDKTASIVEDYSRRDKRIVLIRAEPGRGRQMNAAARLASADILLFLHADTCLQPDCTRKLREQNGKGLRAGCFTLEFSNPDLSLRLLALVHNWRFTLTRIAYGDQAVFVRRDLFWQLSGFTERPLEDIRFGERLRRVVRQRRLTARVVTDSRKLRHFGPWRAALSALHILLADRFGRLANSRFFDNIR